VKIEVDHPDFKTQKLEVETSGIIQGPKLLLNGSVVKKQNGKYLISSDSGVELPIIIKSNFIDPVPSVTIAQGTIKLARPFNGLEYAWFIFLVVSLYQASPIGGLVGAIAALVSGRVFRKNYSNIKKIGIATFIFIVAIVVVIICVVSIKLINNS